MKNHIELFSVFLRKYHSSHIINNIEATTIQNIFLCENTQINFHPENLYLIDCNKFSDFSFLQQKTNFILISTHPEKLSLFLGTDTNAILLGKSPDIYVLYNALLKCHSGFQLFQKNTYELFKSLLGENQLKHFCNTVTKIIGSPIALVDISNKIVAASTTLSIDEIWNNFVQKNALYSDELWNGKTFFDFNAPSQSPVIFPGHSNLHWLNVGIFFQSECYYYLSSIEGKNIFDDESIGFFLCISDILGDILYKNDSFSERKEYIPTFFQSIICASAIDKNEILMRSQKLGLQFKQTNYLVMFFSEEKNASHEEIIRISKILRAHYNYVTFAYEFKIFMLLTDTSSSFSAYTFLCPLLEKDFLNGWKASVSYSFSSACDFKNAYEQCIASERFGSFYDPSDKIYDYFKYALSDFLTSTSQKVSLLKYCIPVAQKILRYDIKNKTEYASTLYLYIQNLKDSKILAQILNVHRNTIIYRIERIEQLFGVDMNDYHLLESIKFSFDILLRIPSNHSL